MREQISRLERECTICWNLAESHAIVWSNQDPMKKKLAKMGFESYREGGGGEGKFYKIPKNLISIRRARVSTMSDEHKQKARQRLQEMRTKNNH